MAGQGAAGPGVAGPGAAVQEAAPQGAARGATYATSRQGSPKASRQLLSDPTGALDVALNSPGLLIDVSVTDARGRRVAGRLSPDGRRWERTGPLRADDRYTVLVDAELPDGSPVRGAMGFATAPPRAAHTLTAHFGPESGTYGVGQPLTADLSHPVPKRDRAARALVERSLHVTSTPRVDGTWHWVDSSTLHYRPRTYWPARARITLRSGLDGVKVNDRLVGGRSAPLRIRTGDRIEAVTDVAEHEMTVKRNGRVIRTIPVTTGKPGYRTRGGIKVVLGKERFVRMRGESIGIARGSGDYFNLPVHYATRVTWSGEYVHAAPWSVASQGSADVSHGCTGMSTDDAAWFYDTVRPGDLVQVVNGYGEDMTPFDNGYGDWNVGWKHWRKGSVAVNDPAGDGQQPDSGRLLPTV
ncbi:Ig-like domain-containing protein [Streptomyces monticola]|uniref:Ig-like domain-containing protein n=1 Tax=Streptomyces monticola TaxID=2666263 RepID=A0ABW2JB06_9ACTN